VTGETAECRPPRRRARIRRQFPITHPRTRSRSNVDARQVVVADQQTRRRCGSAGLPRWSSASAENQRVRFQIRRSTGRCAGQLEQMLLAGVAPHCVMRTMPCSAGRRAVGPANQQRSSIPQQGAAVPRRRHIRCDRAVRPAPWDGGERRKRNPSDRACRLDQPPRELRLYVGQRDCGNIRRTNSAT